VIFAQFLAEAHCEEMARDRPSQPAYVIFRIKRRF